MEKGRWWWKKGGGGGKRAVVVEKGRWWWKKGGGGGKGAVVVKNRHGGGDGCCCTCSPVRKCYDLHYNAWLYTVVLIILECFVVNPLRSPE